MSDAGLASAAGFQGIENSPLARIGYHNKIIALGWEQDFLPMITNTEIDERILRCNQIVQFTKQPSTGEWREYEKNQELVADQVSPEGFTMKMTEAKYKAFKFDTLDVKRICERWADFEASFLNSAYNTLSAEWRNYALTAMALEASPQNKGANAGRMRNINLGTTGLPRVITGATLAAEFAKTKRVLQEQHRWQDGQMVAVISPAIEEQFVTSPYASALEMGSCVDCSLLVTGQIPGKVAGYNVIVSTSLNAVMDTGGREAYWCIFAHREAFAFAGDIVEGDLVRPSGYFGWQYQMLAVWGSKGILPDAIAVGYWAV